MAAAELEIDGPPTRRDVTRTSERAARTEPQVHMSGGSTTRTPHNMCACSRCEDTATLSCLTPLVLRACNHAKGAGAECYRKRLPCAFGTRSSNT